MRFMDSVGARVLDIVRGVSSTPLLLWLLRVTGGPSPLPPLPLLCPRLEEVVRLIPGRQEAGW